MKLCICFIINLIYDVFLYVPVEQLKQLFSLPIVLILSKASPRVNCQLSNTIGQVGTHQDLSRVTLSWLHNLLSTASKFLFLYISVQIFIFNVDCNGKSYTLLEAKD